MLCVACSQAVMRRAYRNAHAYHINSLSANSDGARRENKAKTGLLVVRTHSRKPRYMTARRCGRRDLSVRGRLEGVPVARRSLR